MTQKDNDIFQIRAFVRTGLTRVPVDIQKWAIEQAAKKLDLKIKWYIGDHLKKSDVVEWRDTWAKQLRHDEIGMVYDVSILRLTRKQLNGADPKANFSGLFSILNGAYIVEADTGLTSKEKARWKKRVEDVAEKAPPGTSGLTSERASKMSKDGWKTRKKGVVKTWQSGARKTERNNLIRHWLASDTAEIAFETLPKFIEDMGGGVYEELSTIKLPSLRRICKTPRR